MGTDHDWVAIREVVEAGLRDAGLLAPPVDATEQDLGDVADTVTDHLSSALASGALVKRPRWWRRHGQVGTVDG